MKAFLSLALFAAVALAEPPAYRQQQQQNRYFFARQQEEPSAGYAPSGWRPDGPAFNLPQRALKQQQPLPQQQYGAPQQQQPQQQYGPPQEQPQQQYGPPQQRQQPQQQYGAPESQFGPSPAQQVPTQYRPQQFARQEQEPQQQYGAPEQPQQQYGAPAQPQEQYGGPSVQQAGPDPRAQFARQRFAARQQQQQQQQQQPRQQYGPPQQQQYGPPAAPQQYGAPDYATTELPNVTEVDDIPTTVGPLSEPESEQINASELDESDDLETNNNNNNNGEARQEQQARGEYYVALPDGRLQRVRYVSRQDLEAMRYFAKIRAENVEPLRGPIYAYSPLQKLQVAPGNLRVAVAPAVEVAPAAAPARLTVTTGDARAQKLVAAAPQVDIKPLAQLQIQQDTPASALPLSSSYTTYTANYGLSAAGVPAAPVEERYILAFP